MGLPQWKSLRCAEGIKAVLAWSMQSSCNAAPPWELLHFPGVHPFCWDQPRHWGLYCEILCAPLVWSFPPAPGWLGSLAVFDSVLGLFGPMAISTPARIRFEGVFSITQPTTNLTPFLPPWWHASRFLMGSHGQKGPSLTWMVISIRAWLFFAGLPLAPCTQRGTTYYFVSVYTQFVVTLLYLLLHVHAFPVGKSMVLI